MLKEVTNKKKIPGNTNVQPRFRTTGLGSKQTNKQTLTGNLSMHEHMIQFLLKVMGRQETSNMRAAGKFKNDFIPLKTHRKQKDF